MLRLKLNHVSKRGHRCCYEYRLSNHRGVSRMFSGTSLMTRYMLSWLVSEMISIISIFPVIILSAGWRKLFILSAKAYCSQQHKLNFVCSIKPFNIKSIVCIFRVCVCVVFRLIGWWVLFLSCFVLFWFCFVSHFDIHWVSFLGSYHNDLPTACLWTQTTRMNYSPVEHIF